ncbi:ribose-5-phosphate isomerase [Clostridium sp. SYSU_GA19001]|uniref:ribose-5-phosphate isomerase n=1 Tax=Clostridium caldaquaticum TaxID=2940653 RepID=UPI00207780F0|nr:ribose-5-phosphate isomerase [Clostridium caldaquaticum]MCM8709714.1 ribose-5-phosphate isomerase [Clostridium caldaquaticum]
MDVLNKEDKYIKILEVICQIKGINKEEQVKILKDRECKYLLFLLLKKYKCTDIVSFQKDFSIESKKYINYNIKKAEEKFFINKEFRDMYFEAENIINKTII